ncbi:MAG: pantoate--beta-alanine ligase, partial [Gammaproteobacteria bacterium]|nr:pantoate--beta-alanine ligase [Gammaproteobacteria bacterium]
MQIISDPKELQLLMLNLKAEGKTIGFVPTMGNLHEGHLSLIELSKNKADVTVCSIFVNPLQFGQGEDLSSYPRTLKLDIQKLSAISTDYLFTPSEKDIYPLGKEIHTHVIANRLTEYLCGKSRPTHFQGVTTVVNILFNIVQPNYAFFGKKDYQQYKIISNMVNDLRIPVEVIGGEIVRESNGLAMSSRNGYLTDKEKQEAAILRQVILQAAEQIKQNQRSFDDIIQQSINTLSHSGFKVDYFEIIRQSDLHPADRDDSDLLIAVAGWMGQPRLIDN